MALRTASSSGRMIQTRLLKSRNLDSVIEDGLAEWIA
jgi:hypothetical protein